MIPKFVQFCNWLKCYLGSIVQQRYGNWRSLGNAGRRWAGNYSRETRIEYSNWWGSQYGEELTVMAPSEVIASVLKTENGRVQFDYNARFNGTSAAAPNAAGVASLVFSANPYLSAAQAKQILAQTAVDVGQPGYDKLTGSGVVNADAAVRRAMAISRGYA